jgi:hypothetical protein
MIVFSLSMLSSFGLPLLPTCLLLTVSEARSYFAATIGEGRRGGKEKEGSERKSDGRWCYNGRIVLKWTLNT